MANCTVVVNMAAKPGKYCEKLLMDFCGRLVKNKVIKHVPEFATAKRGNEWYLIISCKKSDRMFWNGITLGIILSREACKTQLIDGFEDAKDDFNFLGEICFANDDINVVNMTK